MQPRVVTVGPLIAASATKIGLSQSPAAAGALVLNGAAGTAVANNICTSQSGTAAIPLTINGTLAQTQYVAPTSKKTGATIAALPTAQPIYITSAGNDSALTWAVVGLDVNFAVQTETIQGTNASVSGSVKSYQAIKSITPSGNTASTVTVGTMGFATLDSNRQVIFTSGGNDSGLTITLTGTDGNGNIQSETITGASGAAATSALGYTTITSAKVSGATAGTIEIGTNGVGVSNLIQLDTWALPTVQVQCNVSGTVNYTAQITNDDPNSYANPVAPSAITWETAGTASSTGATQFGLAQAPAYMRVLLNSGTGSVTMTAIQHGSVTY